MTRRDFALTVALATAATVAFFSPALLGGKILAIGDGLIESVPAFFAPWHLWNPDMLLGYPLSADPNQATFYPLRLLQWLPGGFNAYVMASYAIAAAAVFGYLVDVLHDRIAAVAGAASFAFGGFMIAHFGHPMIDHPTAWSVVALFASQRYHTTRKNAWLVGCAVAIALALSSGQPQTVLAALSVLAAYALFVETPRAFSVRSFGGPVASLAALALGVGLGAVFVVPAARLGTESTRAALTYSQYIVDSLPFEHLALRLAFPYAIGGGAGSLYQGPFLPSESGSFTETTLFLPAAALALAFAGLFARPRSLAMFWVAIAVAGVVLAVGDEVRAVAAWTFGISPFDAFRIPGRHAFEITLALSLLAGFGTAALRTGSRVATVFGILATVALYGIALRDVRATEATVLAEPVVTWFLGAAALEAIALVVALALRGRAGAAVATVAVVAGAMAFGETAYWRDAPPASTFARPAYVDALRGLPLGAGQRIYAYSNDIEGGLRPNSPSMWSLPDVAGYTPLVSPDVRHFLRTAPDGRMLDLASPSLDLAAVRYVAVTAHRQVASSTAPGGIEELGAFLSATTGDAPSAIAYGNERPVAADAVTIVSALGASVDVAQGTTVATVTVRFADGTARAFPLRAGIETAEIAYDDPVVAAVVRHARARVFSRDGHATWFDATLSIGRHAATVNGVTVRLAATTRAFNLRAIALIDARSGTTTPYTEESVLFADPARYRHLGDAGGVALFENERAYPGAWIEPMSAARSPAWYAESPPPLDVRREPERRDLDVTCPAACLLVVSERLRDDWRASVDGSAADLSIAHGVLAAVRVPAGRHFVTIRYRPRALIEGGAISLASALTLALWLAVARRRGSARDSLYPPSRLRPAEGYGGE